jgi:type II secretory pathway pseudopilin PulG
VVRGAGFTLVEVVVALVVIEVGLLGVLGSLILAAQTLSQAEHLERATAEVHRVYDSLSVGALVGEGEREAPPGWLRWTVGADGEALVTFEFPRDSAMARVEGRVPVAMEVR